MCTQAHVFSRFSLRYLPFVVCAVLVILELGLLKLTQRTSKFQKLDAWLSNYKKKYRQSTEIQPSETANPENALL
jgi:hypothetical protein